MNDLPGSCSLLHRSRSSDDKTLSLTVCSAFANRQHTGPELFVHGAVPRTRYSLEFHFEGVDYEICKEHGAAYRRAVVRTISGTYCALRVVASSNDGPSGLPGKCRGASLQIRVAVFLLFANCALTIGITVAAWPVFRQYSEFSAADLNPTAQTDGTNLLSARRPYNISPRPSSTVMDGCTVEHTRHGRTGRRQP